MNTKKKIFAAPEDAYREFFRADSAQQAGAWAAVMSYPHVRVSARGTTAYYETPEAYASGASWTQREATGWVRSVGADTVRLHESADKVHLAGGWTRYNAQDEPILRNRVTYILTRVDGSWGIQARFGTDSFTEGERYDATPATELVGEHLQALARRDFRAGARLCRFPLYGGRHRSRRHLSGRGRTRESGGGVLSAEGDPGDRCRSVRKRRRGRGGVLGRRKRRRGGGGVRGGQGRGTLADCRPFRHEVLTDRRSRRVMAVTIAAENGESRERYGAASDSEASA